MHRRSRRSGFSLIEMVVVVAIMIILTVVGILNLANRKGTTNLTDGTKQLAALLREAQNNSMSNAKGVAWGVRISNPTSTTTVKPFFALFSSSYATTNIAGYYKLPDGVAYVTSTLPVGSTTDIIFTQVSGALPVQYTIGLYIPNQPTQSSTITISTVGTVTY